MKVMSNFFMKFAVILLLFFTSCTSKELDESLPYDPSLPVEVTEINPKVGPAKTPLYIHGSNFGNDPKKIRVRIGGIDVKVIGATDKVIYCIVPMGASEGSVEVSVNESEYIKAPEIFTYQSVTMVSTLCGKVDELGKTELKDGDFDICGFLNPGSIISDDANDALYLVDGRGSSNKGYGMVRKLDLAQRKASTVITKSKGNWPIVRAISFSNDANTIYVSNDNLTTEGLAVSELSRNDYFRKPSHIINGRQIFSAQEHPVHSNQIFYTSRLHANVYRFDKNTKETEEAFNLGKPDWIIEIFIHPSGKYAYLVSGQRHVIYKTEYDEETQTFMPATIFLGSEKSGGYNLGQGTSARVNNPGLGCFVKNMDYVREGKEDVYDFYFPDTANHCIRRLTPDGYAYLFAGRGSAGLDNRTYGYIDGELTKEARFNKPTSICYNESNKTFYITDSGNYRIRTIMLDK